MVYIQKCPILLMHQYEIMMLTTDRISIIHEEKVHFVNSALCPCVPTSRSHTGMRVCVNFMRQCFKLAHRGAVCVPAWVPVCTHSLSVYSEEKVVCIKGFSFCQSTVKHSV